MKKLALSMALLILSSMTLVACGGDTTAQNTPITAPPTAAVPGVTTIPGAADSTMTTSAAPSTPTEAAQMTSTPINTSGQDAHITVQHILIGFKDAVGFQGNVPPKAATRTQDQAKALAYDIFKRAQAGEDFNKLVTDNTDDSPPGIYSLSNLGATSGPNEYPRDQMVPAFGNVGFALKMGEIGIADYDPQTSPFGYHIIKRVETPATPTPETKPAGQDDHITVQHILIGFKDAVGFQGNVPPKAATRTQDQAKALADDLLKRAKAGEDFDKLVTDNTDDSPPGIYSMSNLGVAPDTAAQEYGRRQLVPAFGDVGFGLKVGEIGLASYDPATSPFGYHIIKRIK